MSNPQFTEEEAKKIKSLVEVTPELLRVVEDDKRAEWVKASIKSWSIWIVGVITAISMSWDTLINIIKSGLDK